MLDPLELSSYQRIKVGGSLNNQQFLEREITVISTSVFLEAYLLDIASSCRDDYIISRSEQGHLAPSVVILEHVRKHLATCTCSTTCRLQGAQGAQGAGDLK